MPQTFLKFVGLLTSEPHLSHLSKFFANPPSKHLNATSLYYTPPRTLRAKRRLSSTCKMPASDALQPPLTPAERAIVRSYGGWTYFMLSFGLKPWEDDDSEEGKKILEALARDDEDTE
ncbi:hypothetical protein PENCOP_c011G04381 [Penicillium coprophilum]|uniref:Uncharacterized protein n=1 Tax=Penicillium coprophilum TaxID=36646 RepID=A0A1V6UE39_9EURO|nr:hypothetical protein PENCOP_c011G04381 [Penicillium coprophilum]